MSRLTVNDLGFDSPAFAAEIVARIAQGLFGLTGEMKPLPGERDQNTLITDAEGRQYVLKISGATENPESVDFQVRALRHIQLKDPGIRVPRLIPGNDGELVQVFRHKDQDFRVRLLIYMPGIRYSKGPFPSAGGLRGIGVFLARLDRALSDFTHPAVGAFMPWDIGSGLVFSEQFRDLVPEEAKDLCLPLLDELERNTYPELTGLRRQVIHQDAHGSNLLRAGHDSEEVTGIIDFGDMVLGPLISDVAVSASHFMEKSTDPQGIGTSLCEGFHSVTPLRLEETDVLLDLVISRQILTIQLYEFRRLNMPHSPPQDPDEKQRVIASLKRLASLDKQSFRAALKSACGL